MEAKLQQNILHIWLKFSTFLCSWRFFLINFLHVYFIFERIWHECNLLYLFWFVQYQQEIALLQEKLRVAALRQDECEARLLIQDQQNQRMLLEYQVRRPHQRSAD